MSTLSEIVATKLIWSLTSHGLFQENLSETVTLLQQYRISIIRAIYSHHFDNLVPQVQKEWNKQQAVSDNLLNYEEPTFLFELVGRRSLVSVPNNEFYFTDDALLDVSFSVDFDACAQNAVIASKTAAIEVRISNPDQLNEIKIGALFNLSFGSVRLIVEKIVKKRKQEMHLKCRVLEGGTIFSGSRLHSTDINRTLFPLMPADENTLKHKFNYHADYVLLSGIKSEEEIVFIKNMILGSESKSSRRHPSVPITSTILEPDTKLPPRFIFKVGSKRSLEMMPKVLHLIDGVLLSRSDLGLDEHPHNLGVLQKEIIEICNKHGKAIIVSSELMQSMRYNPTPTRAEVSDMTNAMEDGADALVLTSEVTHGPYKDRVADFSHSVLYQADQWREKTWQSYQLENIASDDDIILYGAMRIAEEEDVSAIVCFTEGGYTAYKLSAMRTPKNIIAVTRNKHIFRQLNLLRAVQPVLLNTTDKTEQLLSNIKQILVEQFGFRAGQKFVFVSLTSSSVSARNSNLFTLQEIEKS